MNKSMNKRALSLYSCIEYSREQKKRDYHPIGSRISFSFYLRKKGKVLQWRHIRIISNSDSFVFNFIPVEKTFNKSLSDTSREIMFSLS